MTRCAVLLALALVLTGCGPSAFTVRGSLDVSGSVWDENRKGAYCDASGDYPDIDLGAQVVVKDADGKTAGVGYLKGGTLTKNTTRGGVCRYRFTVKNVTGGKGLYSVSIGRRGDVTFHRSEANQVRLSLG